MEALLVKVTGRVQGVWFRASTQQQALGLGLTGWVRNLPDGSVQILMQGDNKNVHRLLMWCHTGPSGANVATVAAEQTEPDPALSGFVIRH